MTEHSGISLKSIQLKNVGVYRDLELTDLDEQGFVTVSGLNKDSLDVKKNSNGAGKSMMFGTIPNLLFEADPLALSKKAKTNMLAKGSEISLEWRSPQGGIIKVQQTASKYKVSYNGEDQKIERQDVARSWIKKHFPLSADEFYSYCYLQSQIPHPFQRARPAERLKYMSDFFKLDEFDLIRAKVKQNLDAAKDAETESKGLADILDVTQRKQKALGVTKEDRKNLKKLIELSDTRKALRNELYEQFVTVSTLRNEAKQYEQTLQLIAELGVVSKDIKSELKTLRKELQQHADFAEYEADSQEYSEQKKRWEKELAELSSSGDVDTKKLVKRHSKLVKEEEELEAELEALEEQEDLYAEYQEQIKHLKSKLSKSKSPKRTIEEAADLRAQSKAIVSAYEKLVKHVDGTTCPTCSQDVDMKSMKRAAQGASAAIDQATKDIEWLTSNKYLNDLLKSPVKKPKRSRKELKTELSALGKKIDRLTKEFEQAKKYDKLSAKLESLKKPKKVEQPKRSRKKTKARIGELEELQELNQTLKAFKKPSMSHKQLNKKYKDLDKEIKDLAIEISDTDTKAQKLQSRCQEFDHYASTISELDAKLSKLAPLIESRQIFEILYKAYSNNALKLKALESRLKLIENRLNENSGRVFAEPMHFTLGTSAQGVTATITRLTSKATTDISIMSGSESSCFRLLYAFAIIPFIPADRRTDFIILDEPDQGCSDAMKDHLIENYLPLLKQTVPNIYWITPLAVEHFSDKQWLVTKQNGVSTLSVKTI